MFFIDPQKFKSNSHPTGQVQPFDHYQKNPSTALASPPSVLASPPETLSTDRRYWHSSSNIESRGRRLRRRIAHRPTGQAAGPEEHFALTSSSVRASLIDSTYLISHSPSCMNSRRPRRSRRISIPPKQN